MAELSSPAAVLEIGTAAPRKWSSSWVRGPLSDGLRILSALWLAPIVLWLTHVYCNLLAVAGTAIAILKRRKA